MQDGAPVLLVNAQSFQGALMLIALSEIKVTAAKLKLIRIFSGDADFVFAVVLASVNPVFPHRTAKPRGLLNKASGWGFFIYATRFFYPFKPGLF